MEVQNCKNAKLRARVRQLTVRDLKGLGDDDAAAAEAGRLKAREARLEARIRLGTADGVRDLLLRREREVQAKLRTRKALLVYSMRR